MAFSSSGTLYTYNFGNDQLFSINASTGVGTALARSGISSGLPQYGKLSFVGSTLYHVINYGTTKGLSTISTSTGASSFIGNGGAATTYENMVIFTSGTTLYGINGTTLYTINTSSGALTTLGTITGTALPTQFTSAVVGGNVPTSCSQVATATETMNWNGSVSTDWNNACNWTPNGIPGSGNPVIIPTSAVIEPEIPAGYSLAVASIAIFPSATLTIAATSTLTVNGGNTNTGNLVSVANSGTLINNGTLRIGNSPSVSVVYYGIDNLGAGIFTNNGTITIERASQAYIHQNASGTFTNTGTITAGSSSNSSTFGIYNLAAFSNTGTLSISDFTSVGFYNTTGTLTNSGIINSTAINTTDKGFQNQNIITNSACGKIIVLKGELFNTGSGGNISNTGLIQIENILNNRLTFSNNGVLKYGGISGTVTVTNNQNSSVIVNNTPTPIFTYGGTFNGTINGIFTNAGATTSAGTYTQATNVFTPSGLPTGSQTLYAKITPSGGACNYIVPFTFQNGCTQVATATEQMTWNGSISTDWSNPCNWTPNGVPGSGNPVDIPSGLTTFPVLDVNATIARIALVSGASLTVNSLKTLTLVGDNLSQSFTNGGIVNNNGTIIVTQSFNYSAITINSNGVFNNNLGATLTVVANGTANTGITCDQNALLNNLGTVNVTANSTSIYITTTNTATELIKNYGTMNLSGNLDINAIIFRNYPCGKIYLNAGNLYNRNGTFTNEGYLFIVNNIDNSLGTFTNNGVLKYGAITGSVSNTGSGSVIVKNTSTPIFTYGGTFNGTVNGIFTNAGATTSAGTYTQATNVFTPSGLPTGSQTLYAKITPSGGACNYIVPFTFQNGCTQVATATETMTWTGSASTDWSNACNWSPNGIPGAENLVLIPSGLIKYPVVDNNVSVRQFVINQGASLTVNALKTLTLVGSGTSQSSCNGTINNNGTITITQNSTNNPLILDNNAVLNNNLGAIFTIVTTANLGLICYNSALINNLGTLNVTSGSTSLYLNTTHSASELVKNYGTMNLSGNIEKNANTFRNYSCGRVYVNVGSVFNRNSDFINEGYLFIVNTIDNSLGTFTNNGVLKYGAITGSVSNTGSGSVIVKNTPTPIFTYGGTFNGTVNGIFTDAGATTSAGTFTAPNTFTPSGLPVGSQTLYAKITPSGGACSYVVPFNYVYQAPPTLTAGAVTNATTCGGATGSIAFTTTNVPDGTYSLSFTTTGTSSPQNVTVSSNAFTLNGLTAGSYNNFSLTVSGLTASTGVLSPAKTVANPASPTLTAGIATNPTTCGGANGSIAFTSTNLPNGTYSLSFTPTGTGATTSPQNVTVSGNTFTLSGLKAGAYSNFSVTSAGCTGTVATSKTLTDPAAPTLTAGTSTNPTTCGGANGSIPFTTTNLPDGTYSLSFTATGAGATVSPQSVTVSGNVFTLSGLKAGSYSNFSVTSAGCTGTVATSKVLTNPAAPTLTAGTTTNPTTCGGTGSIAFTTTNLPDGTYSLSFTPTGTGATTSPQSITVSGNSFILSGLKAATYNNFSVTVSSCVGTTATPKTISDPASPTLTAGTATNPTTCGGANGNIAFTSTNLPNGTYSLSFTATGVGATTSPQSVTVSGNTFSLTGLKAGTYSAFSVTSAGCTGTVATSKTLTDPAAPTLTVGTSTNPTTCGGANGIIPFTSTNLLNGTYSLSFTATGAGATTSPQNVTVSANAFSLTGLKAGTYSAFSVTSAGCTGTVATSKTLTDPTAPTLTAGTATNPTTCGGTGSIGFTSTNLANGTYSLSFTAAGTGATTSPQSVTVSANAFSLTGLKAGAYSNFSLTTSAGCTGSVATSKTLTDPVSPTLTAGTAVNPTTCGGANGSIAFTSTNLANGTYSLSFTATGTGASTSPKSITVSANTFSLTGLKAGAYSNFSLTTAASCTATEAASKTLTDPTAPTLTAGTVINPTTCAGADGSIPFTSTNLPNGTYSLSFTATGTGATASPKSITVSANAFSLTGLKAGAYSNFSVTSAGCTGSDASSKTLTDPATPTITAGTVVNPATCGATGSIPFTATNLPNGTYSLSFTATGTGATTSPRNVTVASNAFSLTSLAVGSYSNFSLTSTGCTATDATSKSIANPTTPTLTAGVAVNPTVCSGTDGSIPFTTNLPDGTYSLSYTGTGSPKSITVSSGTFTLGTLGSGGYNNFSVTNNSCVGTANTPRSLSDPAAPVLTLGTSTNPTACNLSDGSIGFTVTNITDGTYSLTYSGAGTPQSITINAGAFTLTGLADGTYSNFSITNGSGCTGSLATPVTLVDLALPVLTVGVATDPSTCLGTNGTIAFTSANLPDGTYSLSFTSTGTASPQNITVASNAFTLSGLSAGNYSNFSVTRSGCTGTVATLKTLLNPPTPSLTAGTSTNPTTCLGTDGTIAFTTTNLANGTYSLNFSTTGTASPKSVTVTNNTFTLTGLTAGDYGSFSLTNNGCTATNEPTITLSNPATPTITAGLVTAPTSCSAADGSIAFTSTNLPNGSYTITYTGAGSPKTVTIASNAFSLTGLDDGTYSNFSITNVGCTASDATSKTVNNPSAPTLTVGTATNPTTCASTDGTIAFTTTLPNGTYTLSYTGAGSPKTVTVTSGAFTLIGLPDGTFSGFSITNAGCTSSAATSKTLTDPTPPTLTAGLATNPTTCSDSDGTIAFTTSLPNGTYTINYTGAGSPQTVAVASGAFTLTGLPDGTFSGFSVTTGGCTGTSSAIKILTDPTSPTLTAGVATNPTTCLSSDGTIAFTTTLADGTYSLSYTGSGSPKSITIVSGAFTLTGLPDGTFSGFSVTTGGCTGTSSATKTLTDPTPPTLTAGTATNPTTCLGTDGTIAFTTTLPNGTYSLSYTGAGSPKSITVTSGAFTLTGLSDGTYSGFSVTTGGCTGTSSASKTLTDPTPPTLTAGTTTNPTTCLGTDGTIAFTTTLPNGTYSLSYTGAGSPKSITVTSGAFILTGLSDGTYSGFSVTTGGCTGTSSASKTLTAPTAPTLTAGTATNPTTCLSSDGTIAFTTTLPNGTYSLSYTGSGSPQNITVASGAFILGNLPDGTFSGFSVTTNGCTGTSSATKTLTDPTPPTLTAGLATNPTTCLSSDGTIAFTTTLPNGTYSLSYTGSGSPKSITVVSGAFTLTGVPDGTFSGFSVTTGGCTGTSSATKILTDPAAPTLTGGTATNPSTCSGSDGTIAFTTTLPNGTYSLSYTGSGSPQNVTVTGGAFTLTGLPAGTYNGFSVTTGGCTGIDNTSKTLNNPTTPTLTAGLATNPTTCLGTDGTVAFTTNLPNGTYSLSFTGTGSPKSITVVSGAFTLTGLSAGTYSSFMVTNNGCIGIEASSKTLIDPNAPTITVGTATNPTTCSGKDGSIAFTSTNMPNGTYSLSYTGTGSPKNVTITNGAFSLTGLSAGVYSNFSITNNGCTGTDIGSKTLSDPNLPNAIANNVTICEKTELNLSASGGTTYAWTGPNSFSSTSQNPTVSSISTIGMAGVYTVIVSSSNACTAMATANVIINVTPATPSPNAIAPINLGSSATLTATGCTGTLFWYTTIGDVSVNNPVSPPSTTDYYATCEVTANGITCTSSRSANISVTVISNQVVYVNVANTNPIQDGTTWEKAFSKLQDGLTAAGAITSTPVEVWVAKGTYKPTTTISRSIYFEIPNHVKVYGGFLGVEAILSERNFKTNVTTLSGDIGVTNDNADNSYHVVVFNGSSNNTVLDGFNITGGNANFDSKRSFSAPFIAPTTATIETGGGILVQNAGMPTIANCTIFQNAAVTGGGIYAGDASIPKIILSKIIGNQAGFGGAIYFQDGSNGSVSNTLISGNKGIGAVYNNISNPTITNVTIGGNGGYNGGIFNSNSQPVVKNSIIWGNSTPFNDTQSIISYSIIQGGYPGTGNLNYDPQFVNPAPEGLSPNLNGDYHLKANSLGIDRGDNDTISTTDLDLDGNLRRYNGGSVDVGAYEFQGNATATLVISINSGNWESNSTWDIGRVPQIGDVVIIDQNHIVTLNGEANAKNIEYRGMGQLKFNSTNAKINIGF